MEFLPFQAAIVTINDELGAAGEELEAEDKNMVAAATYVRDAVQGAPLQFYTWLSPPEFLACWKDTAVVCFAHLILVKVHV